MVKEPREREAVREPPEDSQGPIQRWAGEINWSTRVKAVCKPCWEIRYCPYGPLVEEFPLKEEHDDKSCRIFGHDCPVFSVAEPLTETKELRRVTRTIPRPMQFRVLKRDNQICAECGKSVLDEDIHFDHIIPWSKGGPTAEHNIRLLCSDCNLRKSNSYEDKYLVESFADHVSNPVSLDFIKFLLQVTGDCHKHHRESGGWPDAPTFAAWVGVDEVTDAERWVTQTVLDLDEFFSASPAEEIGPKLFAALRFRWGWADGEVHSVADSVSNGVESDELLKAEAAMMRRLGFKVDFSAAEKRKWARS